MSPAESPKRHITKLKRAEEELRRTQFSVEHASDAIFWVDSQGHFVYVNEAACRSLGRSREELLCLSIWDINPQLTEEAWGASWAGIKTQGSIVFESQHETKQGAVFPVEVTANYREFDGKEYGFAFVRDISERKQQEDALRTSEKRYRLLFEHNLAGVVRTTLDGRILEVNQAAAGMFGFDSPEEALAISVASLYYTPSDRGAFLAKLKSEKSLTNYEGKFRRKDGEPVWVLENVSLDDGILESTLIDITERKRVEEELYRAHHMLQTILDTIPQRVFWKDRNCTYLGCNRMLASDAGLNNPAEIIGKSDFDLAWSETAEVYRADDKLVMEQGSAKLGYEEVQDRPDGGQTWLRTSKLPLWDREGKVIGVLGTYEDITERKVAEERVQFLAYYDALTGLPNRILLRDRLSQALATARRQKHKVALLFLDLDRFKIINDSLGHSVGDLLLQDVAERLKSCAREQDTVARLGGDEFLIVLTNVKDIPGVAVATERFMDAMTAGFVIQGQSLQHWLQPGHQHFPRRRCGQRNPDQECRCRHVSRQGRWTGQLSVFYGGHECSGGGAIDLGERLAAGTRQERTLSRVPTADGYYHWKDHRVGSTPAVATPEIGPRATRQVHTNC